MYLGNVFYDCTQLDASKCGGIFLDSARYFCYINRERVFSVMERFEPLWYKYYKVAPNKAYKEEELNNFILAEDLGKFRYNLNESFRLDTLIESINNIA